MTGATGAAAVVPLGALAGGCAAWTPVGAGTALFVVVLTVVVTALVVCVTEFVTWLVTFVTGLAASRWGASRRASAIPADPTSNDNARRSTNLPEAVTTGQSRWLFPPYLPIRRYACRFRADPRCLDV
jgi:hypothetical protein